MDTTLKVDGIEVVGPVTEAFARILTPEALKFVGNLVREFEPRRKELFERRKEIQDNITGLNCGRWDYIFSFIKRFKNVEGYLFPDRALITMTRHCMHSYSLLVIKKPAIAAALMPWEVWQPRFP
jgi:malate synthase